MAARGPYDHALVSFDHEPLVIGSGPAGQKAAIQAAKARAESRGGRARAGRGRFRQLGTIPSKTLREAIVYLTGLSERATYGQLPREGEITIEDLRLKTGQVIEREVDVVRNQLMRNHVQLIEGTASFVDPHAIAVSGRHERRVTAENVVIATGTAPARPSAVEFDGQTILDSLAR
jgi:NAD(P) transhydrogenase